MIDTEDPTNTKLMAIPSLVSATLVRRVLSIQRVVNREVLHTLQRRHHVHHFNLPWCGGVRRHLACGQH